MSNDSRDQRAVDKLAMPERRAMLLAGAGLTTAAFAGAGCAQVPKPGASAALVSPQQRRRLGSLEVSTIGLGCMNMAPGFYNPAPPPAEMVKVVRGAFDEGVTFFDTAEVYGPHVSEEIVGEALQPVRNQAIIATKFGFDIGSGAARGRNSRPDHIRQAVEGSLRRLRTDRIDLLYLHRMDPQVPVEDIAGTVRDLIRQGKAREFGMSEVAPDTIRRAHAVQPVAALQNEYSLIERLPEVAAINVCQELGIGFVPWGPTGRAMLTDGFNEYSRFAQPDRRASVAYFTPEALEANLAMVRLVRRWGESKGATPVQIAIAWQLAERPFTVPIPGSTKLHHVKENLGALNVKFTPDELKQFRTEFEAVRVIGARPRDQALKDA